MEDLGENLLIFQIHDSTLVAVVTKRFFVGLMAANRRNFKSARVFNWIRTCGLVMASQRNDANHVQKVEES